MKKFLAILAIAGVLTSCGGKKDEKKEEVKSDTATNTTTPPVDNPPTTDNTSNGAIPKFADAEVQKYVEEYTAFVTGYVDAYKSKDMSKISALSTKATEWATKSQNIGMKLANSPEEAKKFSDYMLKLSKDMQDAMMPK